jgi:hypothetical protein
MARARHIARLVVERKGNPSSTSKYPGTYSFYSQRLPWDWDMDTQVSGATLHHLGEAHNQTITEYKSADGTTRKFLLDVNPWIWERERGDGSNIIDARWIDTQNGLFIDITGLSETHPDTKPGVWVCKNYHRYNTADLYPMRETMFEGVVAKVPYAYDKILVQEYKEKALVVTDFEGYVGPNSLLGSEPC